MTVALAFVAFGESLGPAQLAGGALVLAAVLAVRVAGATGQEARMTRTPLEGKVALVAGATRGAGRGIAVALGEAGRDRLLHRPQHRASGARSTTGRRRSRRPPSW